MNNSYGPSGQSWVIDGISTPITRCGSQGGLASGQVGAGGGALLAPTAGSIGRVDIMTAVISSMNAVKTNFGAMVVEVKNAAQLTRD